MGWMGRFMGAHVSPKLRRDSIILVLLLLCASILHVSRPDHSVLLPIVTAILGFIAGGVDKNKY